MKHIAIITENFLFPWNPNDIEIFLGGSQECVVLLSEALIEAKYNVSVFLYGPTPSNTQLRKGVIYQDFKHFDLTFPWDTIICFKINPLPDDSRLEYVNVIFWSSDVQKKIPNCKYVKKTVCLTEYHKERNEWKEAFVFPHGVERPLNKYKKIPNTMLYCSSFNRGLETLLLNWKKIKSWCPDMKLTITYGYKIAKDIGAGKAFEQSEINLKEICKNLQLDYRGDVDKDTMNKLYEESTFWVLPLDKPDSELFCLNAIKAQNCGCIPVVYKKGALQETVSSYIDFDDFVEGNLILRGENDYPNYSWNEVVQKFWKKIL